MAEPTDREAIQGAIWDWLSHGYPSRADFETRRGADLRDRIAAALAEARGARRAGRLLSAAELQRMRHTAGLSSDGRALLAHVDAQAAGAERLREEVRLFLWRYDIETTPDWRRRAEFAAMAALPPWEASDG